MFGGGGWGGGGESRIKLTSRLKVNALFVQFLLKNIVSEQNKINIESGKSFDI